MTIQQSQLVSSGGTIRADDHNRLVTDVSVIREATKALPPGNAVQIWKRAEWLTAGTSTWVCPAGVYTVYVTMCGGGGGGCNGSNHGHQGGGGGAFVIRFPLAVTPGATYTVLVGAGGAGGTGSGGNVGGITSFTASGQPGLWRSGGPGGGETSDADDDFQDPHGAEALTSGRSWDWPEYGCYVRDVVGCTGTGGAWVGRSLLGWAGSNDHASGNNTTPGSGGGGASGWHSDEGSFGGAASLGNGGDVSTSASGNSGFAGGPGAVIIEWQV